MRLPLLCLVFALASASLFGFPCEQIAISGLNRLPEAPIRTATGLSVGQPCDVEAFEAAAKRLSALGLFRLVKYSYGPSEAGEGYRVEFQVTEDTSRFVKVVLSLPGEEEEAVWRWMEGEDPLALREIVDTPGFRQRFQSLVERYLQYEGKRLALQFSSELEGLGRTPILAIHAADPPAVAGWKFEGTAVFSSAQLEQMMRKSGPAIAYVPHRVRRAIDLALRPAYEEKGRLAMKIAEIEPDRIDGPETTLTIRLEEGPEFRLRSVRHDDPIDGPGSFATSDGFPLGELANGRKVQAAVERFSDRFSRRGYVNVRLTPVYELNFATGEADLHLNVVPGKQYRLGNLILAGLSRRDEEVARKHFPLQQGDLVDGVAIAQYLLDLPRKLSRRQGFQQEYLTEPSEAVLHLRLEFE